MLNFSAPVRVANTSSTTINRKLHRFDPQHGQATRREVARTWPAWRPALPIFSCHQSSDSIIAAVRLAYNAVSRVRWSLDGKRFRSPVTLNIRAPQRYKQGGLSTGGASKFLCTMPPHTGLTGLTNVCRRLQLQLPPRVDIEFALSGSPRRKRTY